MRKASKYTMACKGCRKYVITRFTRDGDSIIQAINLTLEEVRDWCNNPETHGDGWFDGYTEQRDFHVQEFNSYV